MRARGVRTPVLILSAKRTVDDRVRGLQAGGDDYLTKPFAFAELLARVQALIRRATGATEPTRLTVGDLTLDLLTRRTERAGRTLDLRPREFALLEYLMRNPGRVLTKTMILSHVWGYNFNPGTNVVDVLVSRLREKSRQGLRAEAPAHRARRRLCAQGGGVSIAVRGWRLGARRLGTCCRAEIDTGSSPEPRARVTGSSRSRRN